MAEQLTFNDYISRIDLLEFIEHAGYRLKPKAGLKYPVYESEDGNHKIIYNPRTARYFNPHDDRDKGNLINFVMYRIESGEITAPADGNVWNRVNSVLKSYLNIPDDEKERYRTNVALIRNRKEAVATDFSEPLRPLSNLSFLTKRGIAEETVRSPLFEGVIGNAAGHYPSNIAFPYVDVEGATIGLEARNEGYKYFYPGSNRSEGLWMSRSSEQIQRIVVCEAPIDCLSYHQLTGSPGNRYIATGGTMTVAQLATIASMAQRERSRIVIACDNDLSGARYTVNLLLHVANCSAGQEPMLNEVPSDTKGIRHLLIKQGAETIYSQLSAYNALVGTIRREAADDDIRRTATRSAILLNETPHGLLVGFDTASPAHHYLLADALVCGYRLDVSVEPPVLNDYNDDLKCVERLRANGFVIRDYADFKRKSEQILRPYLDSLEPNRLKQTDAPRQSVSDNLPKIRM